MNNPLNIDNLLINDFKIKLDQINPADYETNKIYGQACLKLGKKLAKKHKKISQNYTNFCLAKLIACNSRSLDTQKNIIRYVWDLNNSNNN